MTNVESTKFADVASTWDANQNEFTIFVVGVCEAYKKMNGKCMRHHSTLEARVSVTWATKQKMLPQIHPILVYNKQLPGTPKLRLSQFAHFTHSHSQFLDGTIDLCYGKFLVYCAHKMVYVSSLYVYVCFLYLFSCVSIVVVLHASALLPVLSWFFIWKFCVTNHHKLGEEIYVLYYSVLNRWI